MQERTDVVRDGPAPSGCPSRETFHSNQYPLAYRQADLAAVHALWLSVRSAQDLRIFPSRFRRPLSLQLELMSRCNLNCDFCYNRSGPRAGAADKFGSSEWVDVAEELAESADPFQVIISGGEPLLYERNLSEIMEPFARRGAAFVLITNGWLLRRSTVDWLKQFRFYWLQVSIDSIHEHVHDRKRGRSGSWRRAVRGAELVSEAGIPLEISASLAPSEIEQTDALIDLCWDLGATKAVVGLIMPSGRAIDNADRYRGEESGRTRLDEIIEKKRQQYAGMMQVSGTMSLALQLNRYSILPATGCIVRPNGDVRLDCMAPFIAGNIRERGFSEIWQDIGQHAWEFDEVRSYVNSIASTWDGEQATPRTYVDPDRALAGTPPGSPQPLRMLSAARAHFARSPQAVQTSDVSQAVTKSLLRQEECRQPPSNPSAVQEIGLDTVLTPCPRKIRREETGAVATDENHLQFHFLNRAGRELMHSGQTLSQVAERLMVRKGAPGKSEVEEQVLNCARSLVSRGIATVAR